MSNALIQAGSQPTKPTKFVPIFVARFFQGLITQRSPLRDGGASRLEERYYGARGDALIAGSNVELSNRLTIQRRPGLLPFNSLLWTGITSFYDFRYFIGVREGIQTIADTSTTVNDASTIFITAFSITTNVVTITAVNGLIPHQTVTVSGLSVGTYLNGVTLTVKPGVSASSFTAAFVHANVASTPDSGLGCVQDTLYTKGAGEGASFFQHVGNNLYFGTGATNRKYVKSSALWTAATPEGLGNLVNDDNGNIQQVTAAGTTAGSYPTFSSTSGGTTTDGGVTWTCRGTQVPQLGVGTPATAPVIQPSLSVAGGGSPTNNIRFWAPASAYVTGSVNSGGGANPTGYSIIDTNGNVQIAQTNFTSGATMPLWGTKALQAVKDGNGNWNCWGSVQQTWLPNQNVGTGEIALIDPANNLQVVVTTGVTGATQPSWAVNTSAITTDNTAKWFNLGPANVLAYKGYQWCYAYHTADLHVGSTSPLSQPTSAMIGNSGTFSLAVKGAYSTDPQVDKVQIFRTVDGGATPIYVASIDNNVAGGTFTYTDANADASLNEFLPAPINGANSQPPAGWNFPAAHLARLFGAVGNTVYYSNAFNLVGIAVQSFPSGNYIGPFPAQITRLLSTTLGLLVFTISEVWLISGNGITSNFVPVRLIDKFGLLSYNALWLQSSDIFMFTSDKQLVMMTPNSGTLQIGQPIGDQLESINPSNAYVTYHLAGSQDQGLYVTDGSTGWYRANLSMVPDGNIAWSPKATITNGCAAVQSIEVAPGVHKLLVAPTAAAQPILMRDINTFSDNGATYGANYTIGSIVLSQPGQIAMLGFLTTDSVATGARPQISYIADEALPYYSGAFTSMPNYVNEPPYLATSVSRYRNRHYFSQTQEPTLCQDIQIRITYPFEANKNELLALTIFGASYSEG